MFQFAAIHRIRCGLMFLLGVALAKPCAVAAQDVIELNPPLSQAAPRGTKSETVDPLREPTDLDQNLNQMITQLVLANIPHTYTDDKKWGMTDRRFDGVKLRREGLKIETKRKWKTVNHGTWKKYTARLVDPKQKFSVEVKKIRAAENGRLAFEFHTRTPLAISARQSKWVKGIQLYSISADARAEVRLRVDCELGIRLDPTKFPPDVLFDPEVTDASLEVIDFDVDRVSKLGGEVAQQVTKQARSILDDKIEEKEHKLVEKLNRSIDKKRDRMRLSISDAVKTRWTRDAKRHLPSDLQRAVDKFSEEPKRRH